MIVGSLEDALKRNPQAPYLRWIIDGIGEQMRVPLVAKRNALHEMSRKASKAHLCIYFMVDEDGNFCIRLNTDNVLLPTDYVPPQLTTLPPPQGTTLAPPQGYELQRFP